MLKKRIKRYLRDFVLGDAEIAAAISKLIISEILSSEERIQKEIAAGCLSTEVRMRGEIEIAKGDIRRVECKAISLGDGDMLVLPGGITDDELQRLADMIPTGERRIIVAADDVAIVKLT